MASERLSSKRTENKRKYIRYEDGCEMYGMSLAKFKQVAREADAVYKVGRLVLINPDKIDQYIESCRVKFDEYYD